VVKNRAEVDGLFKANPCGVPISTGGWAGSGAAVSWATTNYYLHKAYPDLVDAESVVRGPYLLFGAQRASNTSLVATARRSAGTAGPHEEMWSMADTASNGVPHEGQCQRVSRRVPDVGG